MAISVDYAQPVTVNGYSCRNCTDVDYAKKNIDPAHPKSGPFGVTADSDPTQIAKQALMVNAVRGPDSEGRGARLNIQV